MSKLITEGMEDMTAQDVSFLSELQLNYWLNMSLYCMFIQYVMFITCQGRQNMLHYTGFMLSLSMFNHMSWSSPLDVSGWTMNETINVFKPETSVVYYVLKVDPI